MIERGTGTTANCERGGKDIARVKFAVLLVALLLAQPLVVMGAGVEESPNFISPVADDRFESGWMDSEYNDSSGETIDIRLYYPANTGGENAIMDCAWAPYPWVVYHGDDGETFDAYNWVGDALAKAGYVTVVIGEERGVDRLYQAIVDHLSLIERIGYTNLTGGMGPAGSQGCIDIDHWGVAGHGRGAGLAIGVYSYWNVVFGSNPFQPPRALFGLGLDTDQIGTQVDARNVGMPNHALFLTGTVDDVAPIDEHIEPLLQNWLGGWQLLEVVGANHVQYEDDQSFLDNLFDGDATMTASEQQSHAASKIKPYLDLTLKGSDEAWYTGTSRENNPNQPTDADSYLSENLEANQFFRVDLAESILNAPAAREGHIMFFDGMNNRTIMATGAGDSSSYTDQWSLDLNGSAKWESMGGGPTSVGRYIFASDGEASGLALVKDEGGDRVTWSWNGYSSSWSSYPLAQQPPGHSEQSLVWDNGSQRYIAYGGATSDIGHFTNETWAFDPQAGYWYNLSTPNSPEAVMSAAAFYSTGWNRTLLFGGVDSVGYYSNQTWMYNGDSNRWSRLSISGEYPSARAGMAVTVDAEGRNAYLFGGIGMIEGTSSVEWKNDLWRLDLDQLTWTQLPSVGIERASSAKMSFDETTNQLVLFGGYVYDGRSDNTWLYNLTTEAWTLHDSSSAITASDVIHLSATVSERDLDTPPANLSVVCRVNDGEWVSGSWNLSNQTAECDHSPLGIAPGFHQADLRVELDGKMATTSTTFERANAPPIPASPMPQFTLIEESSVFINASQIATDDDDHELRFKNNYFLYSNLDPEGEQPNLDFILREGRRVVEIQDLTDWTGRSEAATYEVCVIVLDEATQGNPPAEVNVCFDLFHQPVDDPFTQTAPADYTMDEDAEPIHIDLASHFTDQEGDLAEVWFAASGTRLAEEHLTISTDDENSEAIYVSPNEHWNGETNATVCLLIAGLAENAKNAEDCFWLDINFTVTPVSDPPIFNVTDIIFDEDTVSDTPLSQIVWDPDGDALNITLDQGESHITLEIWHEQLRITPENDWFGRSVNWAILASDGNQTVRQPLRITVTGIDDESLVQWSTPANIIDNLTQLRFEIRDVDSDGPWLVEYRWNDGDWQEISPSCAELNAHEYECQADLLAHQLDWGDHKIYLRVNDGDATSDIKSFWLEKPDPDYNPAAIDDASSGLAAAAILLGGILLLGGAVGVVVIMMRSKE